MTDQWYNIHDDVVDFRINVNYLPTIDAADITIKKIIENYPPPYYLMVSGGVDSQAMMYCWKQFGKNYIPTSVIYNDGLNQHDLETLDQFSQQESININFINFDLLSFYKIRYPILADEYQCISPHFGAHLGMAESLPGTIIYSGDRIFPSDVIGPINSANSCLLRASKKTKRIVPYFFIYTPELAYSLKYELSKKMHPRTNEIYMEKIYQYQLAGIPVIPQKQKFTGFEKVKDYYDEFHKNEVTPKISMMYRLKHSRRTYDLLLRYPYEKKFGNPVYKYLVNNNL